ncbi:sigma 54-interacting transcriptional regulator [Clostridium pasteurianum]|uniref:sigma-54-dependent Fis family transcriptional regulator n=1 Tax=Clostridium pasteurianum TaxID=1501 RepID=UPI002260BAB8|nr:sigma 54-interacting transcriptional regulator [Clostridium pasteurianum]UZW16203.1 sigma 54-interacting transcriptional regulator [Clostridium pasteurianum]
MNYSAKIEKIWDEFVNHNRVSKDMRQDILNSWMRCKGLNVNPNMGEGKKVSIEKLNRILDNKKELIQIALPVMLDLYNLLKESNYSIILTDENAVILKVIGNETIMDENRKLSFLKGCCWLEKDVGTNAIGTSIYLNKPMQILGAEHYCKKQHQWTCSASPIHDSEGNIIGCINLSGNFSNFHSHTIGIVVEAADTIQKQFSMIEQRKLVDAAFNSIDDGLLVMDNDFRLKNFNSKLCNILKISKEEIYDLDIKFLFKDVIKNTDNTKDMRISDREAILHVKKHRIECNINITPVEISGIQKGLVIIVKNLKNVRSVINKMMGFCSKYSFENIMTEDPKMLSIIDEAKNIAKNECSVLIMGESGTGKELFAHSIHNESSRRDGPFVAINCAALPKNLVESEIFGYEAGAFTGASKEGYPGKFELANGGTIFLDEIGELPLEVQSKLLRVLDNHTITRLGGKYERKLNVRVLAATNRDLYRETEINNFRSDLYYRLNVFSIHIPPLRKRKEDIVLCANLFLDRLNNKNCKYKKIFGETFINEIKSHNWPGNVRELENVVQRAYYLSKDEIINYSFVYRNSKNINENKFNEGNVETLKEREKDLILKALKNCNGNVVEASKLIGIGKSTLYRKIKIYDINNYSKSF